MGGHSAIGWNDLGGHSTLGHDDRGSFYSGGHSTLRQRHFQSLAGPSVDFKCDGLCLMCTDIHA